MFGLPRNPRQRWGSLSGWVPPGPDREPTGAVGTFSPWSRVRCLPRQAGSSFRIPRPPFTTRDGCPWQCLIPVTPTGQAWGGRRGAGQGVGWWPHQGDTSAFPNCVSSSKSRAALHKPNSPGHQVLEFKVTLIYYQLLAPLLSLRLSPLTHFIIYASLGLSTWEHHGEVIAK